MAFSVSVSGVCVLVCWCSCVRICAVWFGSMCQGQSQCVRVRVRVRVCVFGLASVFLGKGPCVLVGVLGLGIGSLRLDLGSFPRVNVQVLLSVCSGPFVGVRVVGFRVLGFVHYGASVRV
jgi:hypothetical protein